MEPCYGPPTDIAGSARSILGSSSRFQAGGENHEHSPADDFYSSSRDCRRHNLRRTSFPPDPIGPLAVLPASQTLETVSPIAIPISGLDQFEGAIKAMEALPSLRFDVDILARMESEGFALEVPIQVTGAYVAPDSIQALLAMDLLFKKSRRRWFDLVTHDT